MAPAIPLLMNFCSTSFASERVPASARCTWGASNRNQNFHLRGYGARVKNFIDITALAAHRLRGWRNGGSQCCRLLRPWRHRSDVRWTGSRLGSVRPDLSIGSRKRREKAHAQCCDEEHMPLPGGWSHLSFFPHT